MTRVLGMGCPYHCNSGGKRTENLSPQPPRVFATKQLSQRIILEHGAGQGIPDPDRGAHWAGDTVYSSCVLFLVSLVIDLCSLTAVEESL